eukprot:1158537-Pelagomonas_calceolata.AAC.20
MTRVKSLKDVERILAAPEIKIIYFITCWGQKGTLRLCKPTEGQGGHHGGRWATQVPQLTVGALEGGLGGRGVEF